MNARRETSAGAADWLDDLLIDDARAMREAYIADDGFTARTMQRMTIAAPVPAWRRPAVMGLWSVAAVALAVAMPGTLVDVARESYRFVASQPLSLPGLATAALAMLGLSGVAAAYALRTSD